ncbi:amino acid permease [Burkholderia sp. Ax-1719]|nr:amino acid permease [Burkholderia sp. Ax-1719]NIE66926.1 amino acid permease [Burkholderia sp. Ax-1719]
MGIVDVVAIGVGSAVGVSIFSIMAPAAKVAGSGMLIALLVAAIPMVVFAIVYAYMGSIIPRSGASYDWPAKFVHPYVGFMVAWLRVLGNTGAIVVLALVMVKYIGKAFELPEKPTMLGIITIFYLANLLGVQLAARVERVLVLLKLLAFGLFVVAGISAVQSINFHPVLGFGWGAVIASLPLLITLYMGIESATEVGEEIKNGKANIAKGITWAVTLSGLVYLAVATVALGVLGAPTLGSSDAPLIDAGSHFLGAFNKPLIIFAAVASISTSINAIFMTFTRFLFAMGRDGVLPSSLAKLHPKWNTPHVATTVVYVCALAGLLLGTNLVFLFLAVNIPTMLKYFSNCWSAVRLARNHPELHAQAKFALSHRAVKVWGYLGMLLAIGVIAVGLDTDWRPYVILAAWGVLGTAYWLSARRRSAAVLGAN